MNGLSVLLISLVHVAYGVFCVKVFAVLEGNELGGGAMSLFGAVFFMPILYWLGAKVFKRSTADVFDIFAICMIFTLMCARCNCLLSGCCMGRQITFSSPLRWPTREIEILYYVLFLASAIPKVYKQKTHGEVYPFYMFTYGILRFVLEFFRVSDTNSLFHLSHLWALIAIAAGCSIYFELKKKYSGPKKPERAGKTK